MRRSATKRMSIAAILVYSAKLIVETDLCLMYLFMPIMQFYGYNK